MSSIPLKIQRELEKHLQLEWIEEHDRIYQDSDLIDKLKIENQYLFWKKNCDIRKALQDIEAAIIAASKPSVRLAGWSEIARKAKCDRNTLKHPERYLWVEESRKLLINKINREKEGTVKLEVFQNEEEIIQRLEQKLALSKIEAAKWFVKYEESERENKQLRQTLERQITNNEALGVKLASLRREIKNLT